jgi:hypothetical protein
MGFVILCALFFYVAGALSLYFAYAERTGSSEIARWRHASMRTAFILTGALTLLFPFQILYGASFRFDRDRFLEAQQILLLTSLLLAAFGAGRSRWLTITAAFLLWFGDGFLFGIGE